MTYYYYLIFRTYELFLLKIPRKSNQPCNHHHLIVRHCAYLLFTGVLISP